jgi:menaquinone-specific isochorismate synthase
MATRRPLEARTVELQTDVDLAGLAGHHGVLWQEGGIGIAGLGVAARVTVAAGRLASDAAGLAAEVGDLLSSIEVCEGQRPVAVGALPFSSAVEGELIVPEIIVRREDDGGSTLTLTGSNFDPDLMSRVASWATDRSHRGAPRPGEYLVRPVTDTAAWCERVAEAACAVAAGALSKVVLAREVDVLADRTIPVWEVARRLATAYPTCVVFAVDGFVGASPELLLARDGDRVASRPLAGTAPRNGQPGSGVDSTSWLMSSPKERLEHRLVVDAVAATLASFCRDLSVPETPSIVPVGTIAHLGTHIEGRLDGRRPSALELAAALHPTPAVAGTPTEAAVAYLAEAEGVDRGRYAGPVGWVDAEGDGRWAVGIRSAQLSGRRARLVAGAGIVADSVAEAELIETELKLQPMLNAIVRP